MGRALSASSLRGRLFLGFVLVAVPPLLILTGAAASLVSRGFEEAALERLESGLETVRARIEQMRRRAEAQVVAVVSQDLPAAGASDSAEHTVAADIAARRELAALEIVDAGGRVVSSAHWPAGFGLEDRDGLFPGDPALRLEKVGKDYGAVERLALMPERPAVWRGVEVTVRGGPFLDGEFLADLSRLMGAEVAFYDQPRGRWIVAPGSPLASFPLPPPEPRRPGREISSGGASYRVSAASLGPSLLLLVAVPAGPQDAIRRDLRGVSLLLAAGALLAALVAAFLLSARLSRPIRELARGVRRVAEGDLEHSVPVLGPPEIADLARTFNAMTHELRASRERLVQAERVAAWREIAQRLAHELKKPLFPIQLSLETLRRSAERAPADGGLPGLVRESTETMLNELRSLQGTIDEFSQFARMPRPQRRPTDLNAVVEQVLSLYRARARHVTVETALAPDLPLVAADPDLLSRALTNLVANALEAMTEGGTLRLRTLAGDGGVAVAVEDTGPGLNDEQRKRLFTPYYTTKKGGTGLGLAIVQGIVSDHGGRVEVASAEGGGTTFTLVLSAGTAAGVAGEGERTTPS
jgi:nitrogen fixation/metabolism regulation signal transduction histidine kinase